MMTNDVEWLRARANKQEVIDAPLAAKRNPIAGVAPSPRRSRAL
jgi:hypothetical protein